MQENKTTQTEQAARRTQEARKARAAAQEKELREREEQAAARKADAAARKAEAASRPRSDPPASAPSPASDLVIGKKFVEIPVRSAIPYWIAAGAWLLCVLIFPIYKIWALILGALVAALAFFIASKCVKKETRRVEVPVSSGNVEVDDMIRQINAVIEAIETDRRAVLTQKPESAGKMYAIQKTAADIRDVVAASPDDLRLVRKFLNYYLPTTVKLCDKYAGTVNQNGSGESINEILTSIESALAQLDVSYKNLYDSLYSDDALDVTTDVQVLETMIQRDNLG